jgi:cytochrome c oxidase cbb3-type subunit 3
MQLIKRMTLSVIAILLSVTPDFATETSAPGKTPDYNMALISLVGIILILLFVIGMLANTLKQLSFVVRDKVRKDKTNVASETKAILLFLALMFPLGSLFAADTAEAAKLPVVQYIQGIPETDFYVIVAIIALELFVIFALSFYIHVVLKVIKSKPELAAQTKAITNRVPFWDKLNKAVSIEKEKEIILDHDYDGIQELDNSLPPWWKYGFYLTIVVSIIYIYRFHISHDGASQEQEYAAEMLRGEEDKAEYLAKSANNVDENSVTLLLDPGEVATGKELFVKTCAACHVADGGGAVGPNLTDQYWLHGGDIKDVFKSIKYGWQDKGMKSWKDDFSPKQIQQIASFIKSLKGSRPAAPKAPQGDIYIEATQAMAYVDSAKK